MYSLPFWIRKSGVIRALPCLLSATASLRGQEAVKNEVQLAVKNPPLDLPAGRTIVALSRLLGHATVTAASCEGGAERGRHVRAREQGTGIQVDSMVLSTKGPFELPDAGVCGFGKIIAPVHSGSAGDDTFILDGENDQVDGLTGNDKIDGGKGDDVLDGGAGNDILLGGDGKDSLYGGEGNDSLFGGEDNDRLYGGLGEDVLEGGAGDDVLDGGPDNDTLFGDDGADILQGGAGDDFLEGNAGDDNLLGGDGNDELDGGAGDDRLAGGEGDDWLKGEAGRDVLEGGPGNDRLEGQDGPDILDGGVGNDTLDGGDDPDILLGGPGDDILRGGDANDTVDGGPGNDKLYGNDGNDTLDGGAGDDLLDGGDGDDNLIAGPGADRVLGGEGNDTLQGGPGDDTLIGDEGDDVLGGGDNEDHLIGGDGRDVLRGGPGNDRLNGGRGSDIIDGGEGNDTIILNGGEADAGQEEIIDGGPGEDTLVLNGFVRNLISGSPGASGTFVITDPVTGASYRVSNVEHIRYTHLVSHLGTGGQLSSTLILANPSASREATGKIEFLTSGGKPLELSIGGAPAKSTLDMKLPPLGSVALPIAALGQPTTGRARIESDQPLSAAVRFSAPNLGTGILPQSSVADAFAVPVIRDRARGISTGVVVINSDSGGHYELGLARPSGAGYDATDITTPPSSQLTRDVAELFPEMEDFQGTFLVSGRALAAYAVRTSGKDVTLLPALRMARIFGGNLQQLAALTANQQPSLPGRSLYFARLAGGPQANSELFAINSSVTRRAKGIVEFFSNDGSPLAAPIEDRGSLTAVSFDLGPSASATYRLRVPVEGSARVRMTEGSVEAMLSYSRGTGSAGLEPSGPYNGFLVPVRRLPGVSTQILISSTGPAAQLQFALRDAQGQIVAGGTAAVALPGNGGFSRSLEDLFPNAPAGEFQGAVTVSGGPDAAIAATVLEQDGARLASLPLIPIQ